MKTKARKMKMLRDGANISRFTRGRLSWTHVSIHDTMTSPLTMLHRANPCETLEQEILSVKAVVEAAPMMNKMNAMARRTK